MVALAIEHYNRLARLIDRKIPVRIELQVETKVHDQTLDSYNVIAEIPGAARRTKSSCWARTWTPGRVDRRHRQCHRLRGHDGSDAHSQGARPQDGPHIRVALWSAEEEGLLGSRAYVEKHFAERETLVLKPEHAKLAAYYNYDNGAGKIRGIYLQSNDMLRPIFTAWLAPFRDLGVTTVTIRDTGATDHQSFNVVGLPGFQFIQDSLDYGTRTHHSSMDVYDRVPPSDLMQSAAVVAAMVYHTAVREQMLPRKPLPKAFAAGSPGGNARCDISKDSLMFTWRSLGR